MGSCILKPTIKNKEGVQVESKLFNDLLLHTGNRESTKTIWGLAQVSEFTEMYTELKYDENGEVTIESLDDVLDIDGMLSGNTLLIAEKKKLGAIDNKSLPIVHKSLENTVQKAMDFNQENLNLVATVSRVEGGYKINLEHKTNKNAEDTNKLMFSHALNNKLRGLMRSLGFDVETKEGLTYDGIFDALSGKETAEGLRTVIEVAKGEVGEQAFPEEFAHFIIEGLLGEPLVARLVESLKKDGVAEQVLGEDFEKYNELYDGNRDTLAKEAAGKLLQALIVKTEVPASNQGLLTRVWNLAKNKLQSLKQSDINNAINEANKGFAHLTSLIMDESIFPLFDKSRLMDSKPLYRVSKSVNLLEKTATESVELLSKRMMILHTKSKAAELDPKTVEMIRELQDLVDGKLYAKSSIMFLKDVLLDIEALHKKVNMLVTNQKERGVTLDKINNMSGVLLSIEEFSNAYQEVILDMTTMVSLQARGEVELSPEDAKKISDEASKVHEIIIDINRSYESMRFDTMYNLYEMYLGKNNLDKLHNDPKKLETLEQLMLLAPKDINGVDRWINSLGDSSDLLLVLTDKMFKVLNAKRDLIVQVKLAQMRAIHAKLAAKGYNTDFMFEKNADGKLTGMLLSDRDFARYNQERDDFIQSLRDSNKKGRVLQHEIEEWERTRTEDVVLDQESGRTEPLPLKSMYPSTLLEALSPAQREYYDAMMRLKGEFDNLIPARFAKTFNAIYIRDSFTEGVLSKAKNPKDFTKIVFENIKDNFVVRGDDTEFGSTAEDIKSKKVITDFAGKKIEMLPVYYTNPLEDMDRLSQDFTSSIIAYASMAINYSEMNKVRDALELSRSFILDRDVQEYSGDRKVIESFRALDRNYSKDKVSKGRFTAMGGRINDYYSANLYGLKKLDEGTKQVFGEDISVAKTLDTIKAYSTQVGLGLNLFTAINNVTMGKMLLFIESMGGEYYNYKLSQLAKAKYYLMLPELMGEINSNTKSSKLGLMIDKFDALEEFNLDISQQSYLKSAMGRILGKTNSLFMSSAGEHYLHSRNMLAMMHNVKMKDASGKEITLFEAYEVKKYEEGGVNLGGVLQLKEGVTKEDGTEFTPMDEIEFKMRVSKVSQTLNGAFSDIDKGALHKYALGRLAMQFRQWMPSHYLRRVGGGYYDAQLSQWREGYYRTLSKFVWETIKDGRRMKFQAFTRANGMSKHELANLRRSFTELAIFGALTLAISMMGPLKDMSDNWAKKMLFYLLLRLELEVGALVPFHRGFFDDLLKIGLSPAAAMKNINDFMNLLNFQNMWVEVESGRYKGWNAYLRDAFKVIPYVQQGLKVADLSTEDYMFTIFSQKAFK